MGMNISLRHDERETVEEGTCFKVKVNHCLVLSCGLCYLEVICHPKAFQFILSEHLYSFHISNVKCF